MDESKITKSQEPETIKTEPDKIPDDFGKVKEFTTLYRLFGIKEPTPRGDEALNKIWQYAKDVAPNKNRESIVWEIIRLKNRVGSSNFGDPTYSKIENYVDAYYNAKKADKIMQELMGNG